MAEQKIWKVHPLTYATDIELLGILQEENAEVIQIVSKIRRFGLESKNPYDPAGKTNTTLLEDEIGDVMLLVSLLQERGVINAYNIEQRINWKRGKFIEYGLVFKPEDGVEPTQDDVEAFMLDNTNETFYTAREKLRQKSYGGYVGAKPPGGGTWGDYWKNY